MKKVALISGGTAGIGLAAAAELLRLGFRVAVFSRSEERRDAAMKKLGADFPAEDFAVLAGDVGSDDDLTRIVRETESALGPVEVLVNNAGFYVADNPENFSPSDLQKSFEINLFAPMKLTKIVAEGMRTRGGGVVINVLSMAVRDSGPRELSYSVSKSAFAKYSELLRKFFHHEKIRVTDIFPGRTDTDFLTDDEKSKLWGPDAAVASPTEVARAIGFAATAGATAEIREIVVMPTAGPAKS